MYGDNYNTDSDRSVLIVLMLTIVIEMMGLGLVLPLFPALFLEVSAHSLVSPDVSMFWRYFLYSVGFVMWPIGAFFGTPFLGTLSDKFGRKSIIVTCLLATAVSYLIMGWAVQDGLIVAFFVGRLLSGFFGGCYDIAQAATADLSTPETKARNMGWITFAVAIGIIIGPLISGFTTDSNIFSWFSVNTPFWIAAVLTIINASFLIRFLKETFAKKGNAKIEFFKVFSAFMFIFTDKRVFSLGLAFFSITFAWGLYIIGIPLILETLFHFDIQYIGIIFCLLGAGNAFSILFLQKWFLKRFSLEKIFIMSASTVALIMIISGIFPSEILLWISAFLMGTIEILNYSSLLALCSNAVTQNEQGALMGGVGAMSSVAFLVSGILLAPLSKIYIPLSIIIVGVMYVISCVIIIYKIKNS
ncbi:MAG TPA: MFS transporter [Victivallales bacterium]|nr:MFS transporter [Victivallales bacterium]